MRASIVKGAASVAMSVVLVFGGAASAVTAVALAPRESGAVGQAHAASKTAKNARAHAAYQKKVKLLAKQSRSNLGAYYQYADVDGDGVHELLAENHTSWGSARNFFIYTYKGGKVKRLFKIDYAYGLNQLCVYRKGKGLVLRSGGHGSIVYEYFKKSGGKYKCIASKTRTSTKYGSFEDGPWSYNGSGRSSVPKATFKKKAAGVTKGTLKKIKVDYNNYENFVEG